MRTLEKIEVGKVCGSNLDIDISRIAEDSCTLASANLSNSFYASNVAGGNWGAGSSGTAQVFSTAVGALTGAVLCTGLVIPSAGVALPLVPYCATIGGFIGGLVSNLPSGGSVRASHLPMVP